MKKNAVHYNDVYDESKYVEDDPTISDLLTKLEEVTRQNYVEVEYIRDVLLGERPVCPKEDATVTCTREAIKDILRQSDETNAILCIIKRSL